MLIISQHSSVEHTGFAQHFNFFSHVFAIIAANRPVNIQRNEQVIDKSSETIVSGGIEAGNFQPCSAGWSILSTVSLHRRLLLFTALLRRHPWVISPDVCWFVLLVLFFSLSGLVACLYLSGMLQIVPLSPTAYFLLNLGGKFLRKFLKCIVKWLVFLEIPTCILASFATYFFFLHLSVLKNEKCLLVQWLVNAASAAAVEIF